MAQDQDETTRISALLVKSVKDDQSVTMDSFWANSPCVITFLRRFGCAFCRIGARDLNTIKPLLDANGVRLIAIAPEMLGLQDFQQGNFFQGELYVDEKKENYVKLGYKRYSTIGVVLSLFGSKERALIAESRRDKTIGGDLKGDGLQTGGVLVVGKGGNVLYSFKQESTGDQVKNSDILKALGIAMPEPSNAEN